MHHGQKVVYNPFSIWSYELSIFSWSRNWVWKGHLINKAAIVRDQLGQGRYRLENQTGLLYKDLQKGTHQSVFIKAQQKAQVNVEESENVIAQLEDPHLLISVEVDKIGHICECVFLLKMYRPQLLKMCHEGISCHLGVTKTKVWFAKYYWPRCY